MKALSISRPTAVGHLQMLWEFAGDYALDGDLSRFQEEASAAAGWDGNPDVFITALIDSGWLNSADGRVTIHDWFEHCEDHVRKRMERKGITFTADNGGQRRTTADNGGQRPPALAVTSASAKAVTKPLPKPSPAPATDASGQSQAEPKPVAAAADRLPSESDLIQALTERGLSPTLAKRHVAETADPALIREILAHHDAEKAGFRNPVGAIRGMMGDPLKWGFERTENGWQRPPPSKHLANGKPAETPEQKKARQASERKQSEESRQNAVTGVQLAALKAELGKTLKG